MIWPVSLIFGSVRNDMLLLRALLYQLVLIITVIPYSCAGLVALPVPRDWRYRLTRGWPGCAIWSPRHILGIRWQIIGTEHLPKEAAVLLSKHQTAWETLFF